MKQRGKDEPPNDGRYDLRRSTVLEVLTRNQVRVSLTAAGTDLYLLEKGETVLVFDLPAQLTLKHVVRLAGLFGFSHDQFYSKQSDLH